MHYYCSYGLILNKKIENLFEDDLFLSSNLKVCSTDPYWIIILIRVTKATDEWIGRLTPK